MNRRHLIKLLGVFGLGARAARAASPANLGPAPAAVGALEPLRLSDAQWRQRLDVAQYRVLRQQGTEAPGSSPLNNERRSGSYRCAGCELPLFESDAKYDSGTGWPSFHTALPGAVSTTPGIKLILSGTEYHCTRCDGHQGHIFDDGPRPTGKRYCNNGVALRFVAAAG